MRTYIITSGEYEDLDNEAVTQDLERAFEILKEVTCYPCLEIFENEKRILFIEFELFETEAEDITFDSFKNYIETKIKGNE